MIPADMTPDRLREDALILATLDYHRTAKRYVRWADELEAQPAPLTAEDEARGRDWYEDSKVIRAWATGGGVSTERLTAELRYWLDFYTDSPAAPDPAVPFPVGARVVPPRSTALGTVVPVPEDIRAVLWDGRTKPGFWNVCDLSPAPTVVVPADVVARVLAGTLTDDDRAVLARAGEGE